MNVKEKLHISRSLRQQYANWPEILFARATKRFPSRLVLYNGIRFEESKAGQGFPWRYLVEEIFAKRCYLPPPLSIGPHDIVLDIGAHIGIFTLFAARLTQASIYAYEPAPASFTHLLSHLALNGANQVHPHQMAVADTSGRASLLLSPIDSENHALDLPDLQSVYQAHAPGLSPDDAKNLGETRYQVEMTTLSEIMHTHSLSHIDFLKMDCEGAEGLILRATPRNDLVRIRQIALEYHDYISPLSHNELRTLLEEAGFTTKVKSREGSLAGYLYAWQESPEGTDLINHEQEHK